MNIDTGLLDVTLKQEAEGYFESLAAVLGKFHRAPYVSMEEPAYKRELSVSGDFVISILFIGTVFGEFTLALSSDAARRLLAPMLSESGLGLEDSDVESVLCEALNIAAGSRLQSMMRKFQRVTITTPRVTRGSMRHGSVRSASTSIRFSGFSVEAAMYLDKMRLDIAEGYREGMARLEAANKSLSAAHESLKKQQAQLVQSEKMASLGIMAAGVAHEINNPLAFVSSNFESLRSYVDTFRSLLEANQHLLSVLGTKDHAGAKAALARVRELETSNDVPFLLNDSGALLSESMAGLERIRSIVNGLKRFSRVDEAATKRVQLNEELSNALQLLNNELKYQCSVSLDAGELPEIECNPGELGQVFVNLLINAAQAMPAKNGRILIETREREGGALVRIHDNGCGIPAENLEKIFTPFFTTKPVGQGTGLGLAISHGIVEKHGGTIRVESTVGRGTTFEIFLPPRPTAIAS